MSYTRVMWKDKEDSATTPLNAYNLNIMDKGIYDVDKKADSALGIADIGRLGRIKPDGVTTRVSKDGTLTAIGGGGGGGGTTAVAVDFDDTVSQLGVNNVQDAIDRVATAGGGYSKKEIDDKFDQVTNDISDVTTKFQDNADWLKSENLFNKDTIIPEWAYNSNGDLVHVGTNVWGYETIPIIGGKAIVIENKGNLINTLSNVWLDADKNKISVANMRNTSSPQFLKAPANASYLGVSVCIDGANDEKDIFYVDYKASNVQLTSELSRLGFPNMARKIGEITGATNGRFEATENCFMSGYIGSSNTSKVTRLYFDGVQIATAPVTNGSSIIDQSTRFYLIPIAKGTVVTTNHTDTGFSDNIAFYGTK